MSAIPFEEQGVDPGNETPAEEARALFGRAPTTSISKPSALAAALKREDNKLDKQRGQAEVGNSTVPIELPVRAHYRGSQQGRDEKVKPQDVRRSSRARVLDMRQGKQRRRRNEAQRRGSDGDRRAASGTHARKYQQGQFQGSEDSDYGL